MSVASKLEEEFEILNNAFSGIGVEEKAIITILGKWKPEHHKLFRSKCTNFFKEDDQCFQRWEKHHIRRLKVEFSLFTKTVLLRAMHPWERDARWAHGVIHKHHSLNILIEIATTRSSEELLGARKAYHSLFNHSIEEDIAYHLQESARNLLVALVSSYRYEGSWVDEEIAKKEANELFEIIKSEDTNVLVQHVDILRILFTRSKTHLHRTFAYYKEIRGRSIQEDFEGIPILQETVQCLTHPATYFSKIIHMGLSRHGDDDCAKKADLVRAIVSRADVDMEEIQEQYLRDYGTPLGKQIERSTQGNFRDSLMALIKNK